MLYTNTIQCILKKNDTNVIQISQLHTFYEKKELWEANLAAILKNGRHLGFSNENNQTKFHACIIIFLLSAPL